MVLGEAGPTSTQGPCSLPRLRGIESQNSYPVPPTNLSFHNAKDTMESTMRYKACPLLPKNLWSRRGEVSGFTNILTP